MALDLNRLVERATSRAVRGVLSAAYTGGRAAYPFAKSALKSYIHEKARSFGKKAGAFKRPSAKRASSSMPASYGRGRTKRRGAPKKKKYGKKKVVSKRKKSGGIKRKNQTMLNIGRNWPPSEMRATFSTNREIVFLATASSTTQYHFNAISLTTKLEKPGHFYNSNNATATTTALTTLEPRNWDFMTGLYKRARLRTCTHKLTFTISPTATVNDYVVCSWYSSDLDNTNPIQSMSSALGSTNPWSVNDEYRDILLQSRRVTRKRLVGPAVGTGHQSYVCYFAMGNGLGDRYGNVAVGGRHVRDATNNPGGVSHTTDKTVAAALTESWGVDPQINIVILPVHQGTTATITGVRIQSYFSMQFYDRNLEQQVAPS